MTLKQFQTRQAPTVPQAQGNSVSNGILATAHTQKVSQSWSYVRTNTLPAKDSQSTESSNHNCT